MKKKPREKLKTAAVGPNFLEHWFYYDFQICANVEELKETMRFINHHGYDLFSVAQNGTGVYTVFFRRRACG